MAPATIISAVVIGGCRSSGDRRQGGAVRNSPSSASRHRFYGSQGVSDPDTAQHRDRGALAQNSEFPVPENPVAASGALHAWCFRGTASSTFALHFHYPIIW